MPTVVLRLYDKRQSESFRPQQVRDLCALFKREIRCSAAAVFDVVPNRDQGKCLAILAREFPGKLVRVGVQPDEALAEPYAAAVQDTWSGLCHGRTNADWESAGFGVETLTRWVRDRNGQPRPVAWDLVAVAWDYSATQRGEYPGYDDAARNMPLPAGRNRLAAGLIVRTAARQALRGFSSDLTIVEANSRNPRRDGESRSLYRAVREGAVYRGYFAEPLEDIAAIYRDMRTGKLP